MTYQPATISDDPNTLPQLPGWVTCRGSETPEDVAFLSGAALGSLHLVVHREDVPQSLLRDRLALRAAEASLARSGRQERAGELRDAVGFLQPGDAPGPAGEMYLSWRRAVERPVSAKALYRAMPTLAPEQIAELLDAGQGEPVARAATVLETVPGGNAGRRDFSTDPGGGDTGAGPWLEPSCGASGRRAETP